MVSVSVKDVAHLAGVSVGTVSNVLNHPNRVSPATVERVNAAIAKLGFVRNAAASQLRAGMSRSVGLVVLDSANPFFAELARGAEDLAATRGVSVLVGNSGEDPGREETYLDLFEEQRVRGILLSPVGDITPRLERLRSRGIATVLVDRHTQNTSFSSVAVDDIAGGFMAAEHLVRMGRKRVAFVGGPMHIRQAADRLEGARRALMAAGLPEPEVLEVPSMSLTAGRDMGQRLAARNPRDLPDAVFAANDMLGLGVMQGLLVNTTLRVPEDIALIGYDDIAFAESALVPMSSIRQHAADLGRQAMELLLEESMATAGYTHRQVVTSPSLVVRASTQKR
ncbi:LacI family DNA-binding transcriptional regulator [Paeniglutamicibacter sp. R2-26]|uniref:LacI family DNA-binding transcriptional regulator n=1 Tax=Paeniglutamicibacter sp. R2-26 TaxID=3144417 RepID=UPI003EE8088A